MYACDEQNNEGQISLRRVRRVCTYLDISELDYTTEVV